MKRFGLFTSLFLVLALAACGGGGGGTDDKDLGGDTAGQDAAIDTIEQDIQPDLATDLGKDLEKDLGWECDADDDCGAVLGPQPACKKPVCDLTQHVCVAANMADGTACEDADKCTMGTTCEAGECKGGTAAECDDNDICTDDACDPATGCTHANNTADCDDNDACTEGDKCAAGTCVGGNDICPVTCGDAVCEAPETCADCAQDCGECPPVCGDGTCNGDETPETCSEDCLVANNCCVDHGGLGCTDPTIEACVCAEDSWCCENEWDSYCVGEVEEFGCSVCVAVCGDSSCNGDETCDTCPADCGVCPVCGDGTCNGDEECDVCVDDCGVCPFCGDGNCDLDVDEDCNSCEADCGACDFCPGYGGTDTCCQNSNPCGYDEGYWCDCSGTCEWEKTECLEEGCGDGTCSTADYENCGTCSADCGVCDYCPGYTGTSYSCVTGNPSGWDDDGYCDCDGACEWDKLDCMEHVCGDGTCYSHDEDCETCPADCGECQFCEGYSGTDLCCQVGDPCGYELNGWCSCDGTCQWDKIDCTDAVCGDGYCYMFTENCQNCEADCGACDFCPNYVGDDLCCQNGDPCEIGNTGYYCECSGTCAWEKDVCLAEGCGDGTCDTAAYEDCGTCIADCGTCVYCTGYQGTSACCTEENFCGWEDDTYCDCAGTCTWDKPTCEPLGCGNGTCDGDEACDTCVPDCGVCVPCAGYTGTKLCCSESNPCGYDNDGYCDCEGFCSWETAEECPAN